jgi:hypothetical protein
MGISDDHTQLYVPTNTGIDRWTYPGFVQTVNWFTKAGGVQSLAVDNGNQIWYRANTGGHLWVIEDDATGDTDVGAINAWNLVYSGHEDCLYGALGPSLYRITLAGTESVVFTGTDLFRPTIQRGGIIWVSDNFGSLKRIDPDDGFSVQSYATSGLYPTPNCGKASVYFETHLYSEGITQSAITCTTWLSNMWPVWTSDYSLILGDDGGSGAAHVYQLRCGAKPPLRIRQRNDDLLSGSPRIEAKMDTMQRSLRIYGRNSPA